MLLIIDNIIIFGEFWIIIIEKRDFKESLYIEIRNVKSIQNKIMIFNKRIDFLDEIINIINKRKLCDVLVDVDIKNFINFFFKNFSFNNY